MSWRLIVGYYQVFKVNYQPIGDHEPNHRTDRYFVRQNVAYYLTHICSASRPKEYCWRRKATAG